MNGTLNRAFATKWHLRRGRKMDNLEKELAGKMKLLKLTKERTADLVEKGNVVAIERQREALISITGSIETEKLEHIETEIRAQKRVYCDSADHKSVEFNEVTNTTERRRLLQQKRLCFNCTKANAKVGIAFCGMQKSSELSKLCRETSHLHS